MPKPFRFITNFFRRIVNRIRRFWRWFLHTSWKKRIAVIIVAIIVLVILKNIFFGGKKTQYSFDTISRGTISQLVTETGNVIASNETDVYSPTTGVLDQIYVHNGEHVNVGDKLFSVRSTATAQEQAAAYANYQTAVNDENVAEENKIGAQASLEQARQAVINASSEVTIAQNRASAKQPNPSTGSQYSQNDLDAINSALTSARETFTEDEKKYNDANEAIAAAQANLNSTLLAYQATQNTTVTAPASGTVANIIGLTGAKVVAQLNSAASSATSTTQAATTPVTPVVIIGTTSGHAIQTTVSEVDVNKIALGDNVAIVFSAIPNKTYDGKIIQSDTFGTATQGVITYNVFISITNPDNRIRPNMTANLTIHTAEARNTLTVANAAIVPYQNGQAVQVLGKNNKVKFIPVKIGLRGFTRSQVLSGVKEGTKVILGNTQISTSPGGSGM